MGAFAEEGKPARRGPTTLGRSQLFDLDDFGFASARADGVVPEKGEQRAREAVRECPAKAILEEE
jgi:ferredoxin